jgi:HAE1 family hydrophobic/amphiphilic exporter-1
MAIWDVCIRRPVFTAMLVSVPVVLGVASFLRLGVELFPNVDVPMVTVTTTLRGASVEEMETGVTKPIEEIVNTVAGIDELRSSTKEGFSQIVVQFVLEKNGNVAAQEVDAKIRTILGQLPVGTDAPIIDKLAVDAAPIVTLAISGRRDLREVTEIARKAIKEDIESIPGVGSVVLVGGRLRAIQVVIDPIKLRKYEDLTVEDVRQALLRENREDPGGRVDRLQSEVVLRTMGRFRKPDDFLDLIVANRNGQPVRIRDIGRVEDSYEEPRGLSRLWGRADAEARQVPAEAPGDQAVSLIVQKQSGGNTVAVAHAVKDRLEELQAGFPPDIKIEVIRDQSRFIENSIEEVKVHLVLAIALVSISVLLFLRDWRATLIASLAIPTSIVGAFAYMDAMGFSLNNFTMIGLILAVGIVVDDAVVVLENIFRHMEEHGSSPEKAAADATKEIALAVLATTFSLMVIFAPIAFMGGMVGRFFSSFGYTVGFSVLLSMAISFTLTPPLCAWWLKGKAPGDGHGGSHSKGGLLWRAIEGGYMALLGWSLRHRLVVSLLAVGTLLTTPALFAIVGKDFVPKDDQSEFEVVVTMPEGCSLDRADAVLADLEGRLRDLRGITHTFTVIGETSGRTSKGQGDVTKGTIYCRMLPLGAREYSQFAVMDDARKVLAEFPDLRAAVQDVAAISASGMKQVDIDLNLGGPDMDVLREQAEGLVAWLRGRGGYVDVDTSLSLRKPELRIVPDRERMSDLGVSLQTVSSTLNVLVGGSPSASSRTARSNTTSGSGPSARTARTPRRSGRSASLPPRPTTRWSSSRASSGSSRARGPTRSSATGARRQVVVSANLDGKDVGTAVAELTAHLDGMGLPAGYSYQFLGDAKRLAESNSNFATGFLLAAIFMYMILAAQFESLIHPISIMAALPLTIPCAVLSLIVLGTNLDIFAMLGVFMLFGIVKKNGILQVDATNQLRLAGLPRDEAILRANRTRLRPILMTTVMLVAAMIPMALGEGPGAGTRASMAKVILGGQALSLVLTLLVTPIAYSLFDSVGARLGRRKGAEAGATEPAPALRLEAAPQGVA